MRVVSRMGGVRVRVVSRMVGGGGLTWPVVLSLVPGNCSVIAVVQLGKQATVSLP